MLDDQSTGNTEIAALAQRVATARGKLPLQTDPALLEELSEAEIAAERDLAEWIRAQRRRQRRRAVAAELSAERRDRRVARALRRADDADARWHRRALAARRRVSSPDARLAQLYRRAEWSSRALIGVVVLGMVWAGVNVQHNLVPSGDMSDPLYWLSYGFEAMISIPIITIMVVATTAARWGREIARGKVVFLEAALLGVTIALNAGPHLVSHAPARAAEAAVAPVMVGVVIWLHAWVSGRYAQLIDAVPVVDRGTGPVIAMRLDEDDHIDHEISTATRPSALHAVRNHPIAHNDDDGITNPVAAHADSKTDATAASGHEQHGVNGHEHHSVNGHEHHVVNGHGDHAVDGYLHHIADQDERQPVNGHEYVADSRVEDGRTHNASDQREPVGRNGNGVHSEALHNGYHYSLPTGSPDDGSKSGNHNGSQPPARKAAADHPYTRRPAHPEPEDATDQLPSEAPATSRTRAAIDRATQLAFDDTEDTPRIPGPYHGEHGDEGEPATIDTWDDGAAMDAEVEVWAVAREISERKLSKLPIEQLVEVLTLADESWTPAAIGAAIGLPGSRILGILEAARRLRPYAVSG
ncbi:hypothetical protein [Nocardia terpenica]|uniref:DUF2637 domain-containing protein n=1 Tax=Nocardia terpenica TaxID=455432 RepID=A0A6G9YY32_9NOCA|nr:hypothetical protein [Nocardia terpenica]QIS17733.1 hypothetical protein F6W96_04850 [Nocardia terpenica]